jgi:hypothetical protein
MAVPLNIVFFETGLSGNQEVAEISPKLKAIG